MDDQSTTFEDKILECICGRKFVHPAGEQQGMKEKFGDSYSAPRLCQDCRKKRKKIRDFDG